MSTRIAQFEMNVAPNQVRDGFRVITPITVGVSFEFDSFKQVSNIHVICKMELVAAVNWIVLRPAINDAIINHMEGIKDQKKRGKHV